MLRMHIHHYRSARRSCFRGLLVLGGIIAGMATVVLIVLIGLLCVWYMVVLLAVASVVLATNFSSAVSCDDDCRRVDGSSAIVVNWQA